MSPPSWDLINSFLIRRQHLRPDTVGSDLVKTVRDIGGLHATASTTPYLSLFARVRGFRREDLDKELYVKRSLGKIRYVRTTVYILPRDFVPIAFAATKALAEPMSAAYSRSLGVSKKDYEETKNLIMGLLRGGGGLSVRAIKQELGTGLHVSPIVNLMCDQGILIRGAPEKGWRSTLHTYHLFKEYFPGLSLSSLEESGARESVVEQYISSFGPVTETDVNWWTGFPLAQVREIVDGLSDKVSCVQSGDKEYLVPSEKTSSLSLAPTPEKDVVNLLPSLDPYMMGRKERDIYLDSNYYDYVFDRSGNATSTILHNGKVIGVWDYEEPRVKVHIFQNIHQSVLKRVCSKAAEVGMFISGKEAVANLCDVMVPLTKRTAGGFISPLRCG